MRQHRSPFEKVRPGDPPPGLRDRVVDAARAAVSRPEPPGLWDLLWESRAARVAWAVTVALLAGGHLLVDRPPADGAGAPRRQQVGPELAAAVELPAGAPVLAALETDLEAAPSGEKPGADGERS